MPVNKIEIFKSADASHNLATGQCIFQEGETGEHAYVLVEGEAEILVKGAVVERAGSGSLLGEMALIEKMPRSATVRAITPCKLMAIDERRFRFLVQQHPFFALQVMKIMAERLRHMNAEKPAAGS
jgi:CRP/FNR family transcriptional regulator, cyclic AMP receptor protein